MSRAIASIEGCAVQDEAHAELAMDSIPNHETLFDSSTATVSSAAITSTAFVYNSTPAVAFGAAAPGVSISSPVFGFSGYCSTSSAFGFCDAVTALGSSAAAFGSGAAATASTFVQVCRTSSSPFKTPVSLQFTNSLIGRQMSLYVDADGLALPPAGQRVQIMRHFDLIKAASWFFAQQFPSIKRHRKEQFNYRLLATYPEFSPYVPVRMMFGLVATACHLLAVPPGDRRLTQRTTICCTKSLMERVTRARVNRVKVPASFFPTFFVSNHNDHCSKLWLISRCISRNHMFQHFILCYQAAAVAHIAGKPDITVAAQHSDGALVFCHLVVDSECHLKPQHSTSMDYFSHQDSRKSFPLHYSARYGDIDICSLLLQCKASATFKDDR